MFAPNVISDFRLTSQHYADARMKTEDNKRNRLTTTRVHCQNNCHLTHHFIYIICIRIAVYEPARRGQSLKSRAVKDVRAAFEGIT